METFQTEEQQVEAIKSFWDKHGNSIIAGLVLGFSGFIGLNYYQDNKLASQNSTSDSYIALSTQATENPKAYVAQAESFINDNANSSYASLTALALAKNAVNKENWANAEKHLSTAIEKAADDGTKAIASLRLARIQIQTEQLDNALVTLNGSFPQSFLANVEVIKGDVYALQGKSSLARASYQTAIDNRGIETHPNLQMKFDDLAEVTTLVE